MWQWFLFSDTNVGRNSLVQLALQEQEAANRVLGTRGRCKPSALWSTHCSLGFWT